MRGCRPLTDPEISRLLDLLSAPAWCRERALIVLGIRAGFDMPLHAQAAQALQDYIDTIADHSPSAFIFPGRQPGTRLSKTAGWRAIKRAFAAAGIAGAPTEVGSHTSRKTFARLI